MFYPISNWYSKVSIIIDYVIYYSGSKNPFEEKFKFLKRGKRSVNKFSIIFLNLFISKLVIWSGEYYNMSSSQYYLLISQYRFKNKHKS